MTVLDLNKESWNVVAMNKDGVKQERHRISTCSGPVPESSGTGGDYQDALSTKWSKPM